MSKIQVMIVDDSVVIRRLLSDVLSSDPRIEICATAANGLLALSKLQTTHVDLVVLDIEMPELDGLGTVREIRKRDRRLPVIMFSTLTERGARATMDALAAGASDYVTKPANVGSVNESREMARSQLVPRIIALVTGRSEPSRPTPQRPAPPVRPVGLPAAMSGPGAAGAAAGTAPGSGAAGAVPARPFISSARPGSPPPQPAPPALHPSGGPVGSLRPSGAPAAPRVLVIGCSTGGPEALSSVLAALPANYPLPIAVVQHMPPVFTTMFAERLDRHCALKVVEASDGQPMAAGTVYLAPGDFHLEISAPPGARTAPTTRLTKGEPENFCRPAVDVLFRSAVAHYGGAVLAVVLTGMGSDGRNGAEHIVRSGGQVIVQDRATSVVWGMPGAIDTAGLADAVLPLGDIAGAITTRSMARTRQPVPNLATITPAPKVSLT